MTHKHKDEISSAFLSSPTIHTDLMRGLAHLPPALAAAQAMGTYPLRKLAPCPPNARFVSTYETRLGERSQTDFPLRSGVLGVLSLYRMPTEQGETAFYSQNPITDCLMSYLDSKRVMLNVRPGTLDAFKVLAEREGASRAALLELLFDLCTVMSFGAVVNLDTGEFYTWTRAMVPTGEQAERNLLRFDRYLLVTP